MRKKDNYMSLKKKWSVFMFTVMSNYATPHPNPFQAHQVPAPHKNLNIVTMPKDCYHLSVQEQDEAQSHLRYCSHELSCHQQAASQHK